MNEELEKMGRQVFETICSLYEEKGFKSSKRDDENLVLRCTFSGDDLPMDIVFKVFSEKQLVVLMSPIPVKVPEDKINEMALAVAIANHCLYNGNFELDVFTGDLDFKMATSYVESILGKDLFDYMLASANSVVDEFNDKFLMLAKGMISLEQFADKYAKK